MNKSWIRSTRLNLTNQQNTINEINSAEEQSPEQDEPILKDYALLSSRSFHSVLSSIEERSFSGMDTARLLSAKFRSQALNLFVKVNEEMKKYKAVEFRDISLVNYCFGIMDEISQMFFEFDGVFGLLKTVFINAIFSDKLTAITRSGDQSIILQKIPFFDYYMKKYELTTLTEAHEKSKKELLKLEQTEESFKKLKEKYSKQKEYSISLKIECEALNNKVKESTIQIEKQESISDQLYKELRTKYEKAEEEIKQLESEVKYLRQYKKQNEAVSKEIFIGKKKAQEKVTEMFSKKNEMKILSDLQKQLQMLENYRIDKLEKDISVFSDSKREELWNEYNNDILLIQNEMTMLQFKVKKVEAQRLDQVLGVQHASIGNRYNTPLRDLDAIKFRNFIELHVSINEGETFYFFERRTINPQTQPIVFPLPKGTTHLKFLFSKYNYTKPHPDVALQ